MKKRLTKLLSLGLALAIWFTSVPVSAMETTTSEAIVTQEEVDFTESSLMTQEEDSQSDNSLEVEEEKEETLAVETKELMEASGFAVPEEITAVQKVVPLSEGVSEIESYQYVLDTDGIDNNGEYAIVYRGSGNRVLYCDENTSDVFNAVFSGELYVPQISGTNFTLGTQIWKTISAGSEEGNFYLQSTYENVQHYYMDLTKASGSGGKVHLPQHNSTEGAPIVKITAGSEPGTYKIQAVSGADEGQYYLGYSGQFLTAEEGIEVHFYKKTVNDQIDISFMFDTQQPDNRWLFLGGEDSVGAFSHVQSGRSYVGHFEEYIRATQDLNSVNVKQRFMVNGASKGRDLSETMESWDELVPVNQPKAISYMISKEDYSKADTGLEDFATDLAGFIDKAVGIGFAVIQYPYKTGEEAVDANIEKYIAKADQVIDSYASNPSKSARITKVDHYTQTGSIENWAEQYLTEGYLNQKGHLEVGKQLAVATIGSSSNYPNSSASSSLITPIYERPETYSDKMPQVLAANDGISVTLSQEIITAYGSDYDYELTTTNEAGTTVVITDNVQITQGTPFVIENLNQGDFWQLQMRTDDGQVQLATVEGTVAEGENGVNHQPVAFTNRATQAQSELADKLESTEPMRWLFVGDSITHACKFTYGYDGISQLFDKYVKETLNRPEDVVINTAVWGAFLDENLGNNAQHRLDYDADVVVIMLGTNDSNNNNRFSNYEDNMNQLLTEIETLNPGATIVIRTPLYVWSRSGMPQYANLVTMNDILKNIAAENGTDGKPKADFLVDQYSYTGLALVEDSWVRNGQVFLGDALHPTHLGQLLLFKELVKELGLEDNDSPMTDLMYDVKTTTVEENTTDIRPYLSGSVENKSITLDVNRLTARVNDLRNVEFTVTHPTTLESRTVKADRQVTTDLTARTAAISWPANTLLKISGLEEEVEYEIKIKGWSISSAKEIVLKATFSLDDESVEEERNHQEAPEIKGYTLVWPESEAMTSLDASKLYLVVAVGANGKAYALYGNGEGVGITPGDLKQADNGKITAELANLTDAPSAVWLKDGRTALDLAEDLEFRLLEGSGDKAGKYAFRTMNGHYLNLENTMFNSNINYLSVRVATDADATLQGSRYLHFNLQGETRVNGQNNAHHTIYNGFWGPTAKPNTYNIYLYTRDGSSVSGVDMRQLQKELDRVKEAGYEEIDYNANSWRILETAMEEAETAIEEASSSTLDQLGVDNLRSKLLEAENGLNRKPVYEEPGVYEYALFTEDDSTIKIGDIFAIYSNNGNARGDNRVLHSPGVEMTDKVQATLQEEGRIIPLESNNNIAVEQQLWQVVPMEGNKIALRNVDTRGSRYLDLSRSSSNNIYLSRTPKAVIIEAVDADLGTFSIVSDEETGYALNYAPTSYKTSEKTSPGVIRLYKKTKTDTVMEIAGNNHVGGTVSGQPMAAGTGGSDNFRIPALITLSDGTIIGAADARWNHQMDFSAIDIMMVKSTDDGQTWEYSFPIFFNDSTNQGHNRATTFIDPLLVRDKNDKIYLMADLFPGSTAYGYAPYQPEFTGGYVDVEGAKRMVLYTSPYPEHQTSENFAYYVGDHSSDELKLAPIYEVFGENDYAETPSFYMDKRFNLYDVNKQPMYCNQLNSDKIVQQNVFYWNSILHVRVAMYLYLVTSEDGGKTWSDPMILNPQIRKEDGNDNFYGVGPGAGLWLDNGTEDGMVILPTYSAPNAAGQRAQFIYSVDGGNTWKRSENVTTDFWSGENCVVQIDDTTLRHFYRSGSARLQYTDHVWEDGTWKAGEPVTMNNIIRTANNQVSAINYSKTINGEKVIIYSTAKHDGGNRENGTIYVFTVDKDTKALKLQSEYDITPVVQQEGGEAVAEDSFQYSSIAELKDGSIGMLHEYDGAKIVYKKLPMSSIAPNLVFDGDEQPNQPEEPEEVTYENIWVSGVTDKVYDGSKQTQNIKVYDGDKLLSENVDYTISYKNNVNANTYTEEELKAFEEEYSKNSSVKSVGNFVAAKEAQVVLKMKGDYSGTRSIFFRIEQQDIKNEEMFIVDNISAQATNKSQKPVPTVTWMMEDGTVKTLKYKKDFTIPEYEGNASFISASENDLGYQLTVQGIGNFMGNRPIYYKITKGEEVSLSKATIKVPKSVPYTGQEVKPEITVKYKNEPLVLDKDYEVIYTNNKAAGTAIALIRGLEGVNGGTSYIGTKRITFKITGTAMSGAKVTGFEKSYPYINEGITPVDGVKVKVTVKGTALVQGQDYEVSYEKNVNKGTATAVIKGNPEAGFTGSKKVTFKIGSANISTKTEDGFSFAFKGTEEINIYPFIKGGVKPSVELFYKGDLLREGVDYTLTYKDNKKLGTAKVLIRGKGNFTGTVEEAFVIVQKNVDEYPDRVYLEVKDVVEGKAIKQSIKVMDEDGKALSNNKDYSNKTAVYTLESVPEGVELELNPGDPITDLNTKLPKGCVVRITVSLSGDFYSGDVSATYRIIEKTYDISKAKIVLLPQEFTGEAITITEDSMFKTRKMSDGTVLTLEGDNANIEVVRYQNNLKKGTAKVTFKGKEGTSFGGYKTVTFKISARKVHNAWEGVVENLKNIFSF